MRMLALLALLRHAAAGTAFSPDGYVPLPPQFAPGPEFPSIETSLSADVTLGDVSRPATPYAFGTNIPVYWGRKYSRDPVVREQLAAVASVLRWPGGSAANQYIWDGNWSAHVRCWLPRVLDCRLR